MNNPNWAEVLSADSALWNAIASGVAAAATMIGVVVAGLALRWARKAALEAGCQAEASIDAANASRQAAEAAEVQVKLLEKQLALAEPQPVLYLAIAYQDDGKNPNPLLNIENVGEDAAFDIEITPIRALKPSPGEGIHSLLFEVIPFLRPGTREDLFFSIMPPVPVPRQNSFGEPTSPKKIFMDMLVVTALSTVNEQCKSPNGDIIVSNVAVRYRNARGRAFRREFVLRLRNETMLFTEPDRSLVL